MVIVMDKRTFLEHVVLEYVVKHYVFVKSYIDEYGYIPKQLEKIYTVTNTPIAITVKNDYLLFSFLFNQDGFIEEETTDIFRDPEHSSYFARIYLNRLENAYRVSRSKAAIKYSDVLEEIAQILLSHPYGTQVNTSILLNGGVDGRE